jgi:solute carrier family 25 (mitochondrial folate transporter), member 32
MSFDSSPPPAPPAPISQYDLATETHPTSRSFNKMSSQTPSLLSPISRLQIYSTQVPAAYVTPICGAGAGIASGIVTCPLDVIKTKLQAQGGFAVRKNGRIALSSAAYSGMIGTARVIWRDEGLRGLYRGLSPMLLGYLPTWAVYLTVYEKSKEFYETKFSMCVRFPVRKRELTFAADSWWAGRCYSSLTAGACSTVLTNPIWVIKTRLMSQSNRGATNGFRAPWHYTSTFDAAKKMYRSEGIRAFYSGLTPALLGLTHVAVQFPLYEYFKVKFTGYGIGEHPAKDGSSHWMGISAATFLSKVCASTATYPHEVLRTRLQTQTRLSRPAHSPEGISYRGGDIHPSEMARSPGPSSSDGMPTKPRYHGVLKTCQVILHEEGWRAFYAGIGTNLVRAVPAAMTTMLTYEWLKKIIGHLRNEGLKQMGPKEAFPSSTLQ